MPQIGLDQLLQRLQQDDRDEDWQILHSQQAQRLRAVACRLVGEEALAEDALQECFLRLRAALPRYRHGSDERALGWLTVIASRSAIDLRRQLRRQLQTVLHDDVDQLTSEPQRGLNDQARAAVGEALAALPDRQRISLLLHIVDGLPHKRVGEALACSERTASSTVHRGLAGLRRELRRRGYRVTSVALLLLPAAWGEATVPLAPAASAGAGAAATGVAGKGVAIGGLAVLAAGLLVVPVLGWRADPPSVAAAPMVTKLASPVAAAAATIDPEPDSLAETAAAKTRAIPLRPVRDLAELVVPVVSLQPRHLAAISFDSLTLPAVAELGFQELWVDGRLRNIKHLPEILPRWQALARLGYRLTLDLHAPVDRSAWQQALAALGPQAVAAVAVYSDPEHPADAPALVAAIRAWQAQRPAWQATPVYDLRETFDQSAHEDWTGCFQLAATAERLEALPPLPANRPTTGPALNETGAPNRLGADSTIVATELLVRVAEALAANVRRLYIHELLDRAAPQAAVWRAGHSHGLVRADGHPRPSYQALQRLRSLLMHAGADRHPAGSASVDIRLQEGYAEDLRSLILRHPDGSASVLLWRAVDRWHRQELRPATIPSQEFVLHSVDGSCRWSLHDPVRSATALQTLPTDDSYAVRLAGELLVVRVEATQR